MNLSDVSNGRWCTFRGLGFEREVVGVVYRSGQASCGLPLGAIGTGHIDLDTNGTLGRCTIFNTVIPPRELGGVPFLGLAIGDDVWALTTKSVARVRNAREIHYWGHYPIADLQYETDAPLQVSLRAWAPFLPGDAVGSNTPGAVFEVRLINSGASRLEGSIAMTFPGPSEEERRQAKCSQSEIVKDNFQGVLVQAGNHAAYFLGCIGGQSVRSGGDLNASGGRWAALAGQLPECADSDPGASVALDFAVEPGQEEIIRFVLAWHCPKVTVNGRHQYIHAYGPRFADATAVAAMLAGEHESLLARMTAWQSVIFSEESLPQWLRDCLVNNFHLLAEDSFWESDSIPSENWAHDGGMFSMVESTRTCPGQACIPSDWFGNLPVVCFFPALAHSTLRGFAHYQLPNGEIPIYFGQNEERQNPVYQLLHLTSPCNYVDLVDRLWQRTADKSVLYELYPSVKRAVQYLMGLDIDADGIIDCQVGAIGHQFYGLWNWHGAAIHVAGLWLSVLAIAERMAAAVNDMSFVRDCQVWQKMGRQSLESKLWSHGNDCYLLYNDSDNGRKDDTILGDQLAGQWSCRLHGVPDIFPADRIAKTLKTVRTVCFPAAQYGSATARRPDGSINTDGAHQSTDVFLGECLVLASTMLYCGEKETGLEIARQLMETIVLKNGCAWDMPGFLDNDTGKPSFGNDFDQMMAVWSLPSAILGQTLQDFVSEGGFVDRIIHAASRSVD